MYFDPLMVLVTPPPHPPLANTGRMVLVTPLPHPPPANTGRMVLVIPLPTPHQLTQAGLSSLTQRKEILGVRTEIFGSFDGTPLYQLTQAG
jgi:hypothetical protein